MGLTIQQAIDRITAAVPGAPFSDTVDTVKAGNTGQEITSIAVTFLATCEVVKQAAALGANLIITHEPTFYTHPDSTAWLSNNPVYLAKRRLIEQNGIVVWRFHDYLHSLTPDSTFVGLVKQLNWEANGLDELSDVCQIQPMTLLELAQWVKLRLGLPGVRVVGDLNLHCKWVALLAGAPGGKSQIGSLDRPGVDVLITGEINEWETSEYVRDAAHLGHKKGLIIIGHSDSEEPGMRWIIPWLETQLPGISIQFVAAGSPIQQV